MIRLSEDHGINPALTTCPRCGGEAEELVLAGDATKYECNDCGRMHLGRKEPCICGCTGFTSMGKFDGSKDKVFAAEPCDKCKADLEKLRDIVTAGGIYWQCISCKNSGALQANEFTAHIRDESGIATPNPCAVQFDETNCPICTKEAADE